MLLIQRIESLDFFLLKLVYLIKGLVFVSMGSESLIFRRTLSAGVEHSCFSSVGKQRAK